MSIHSFSLSASSMLLPVAALLLASCTASGPAASGSAEETATVAVQTPLLEMPTGVRYRLAGSERAPLQLPQAVQVTLAFDEERLHGDSSCNRYMAGYSIAEDGRITLQPIATTKRGCPDARSEIERAWYEALRSVQWIHRDGDDLVLQLAAGDTLRFVEAPPETE
jgi:heat shock protein HslJ